MDVLSRLTFTTVCVFSLVCLNACENAIPTSEFDSKSDGSNSPAGMNILVPIELTDNGILSDVTPVIFNRTRTSLDTSYYDGAVTYSFEIVAKNIDGSNKTVQLIDSVGLVKTSIAIPAGTSAFTYFSEPFTPNSGSDNYRVVLPGTSSVDKVVVFTARIIVRQIGATKTRVYVPMYAFDPGGAFRSDSTSNITDDTIYGGASPPPQRTFPLWRYIASNLSQLATGNPYTVEAVMSMGTGASMDRASLALHKFSPPTLISASEVSTPTPSSTVPQLITTSFSASEISDNDIIEAKIKSSSSNPARIHKAGLWIALENISKVEVYYRIGRANNSPPSLWEEYRGRPHISGLSNPSGFFEICGQTGSSTMALYDVGVAGPSGTSGGSVVTGSSLSLSSRNISRTGALFPPIAMAVAMPYFIPTFNYVTGPTEISGAYLVIQFNK